MSLFQEIGELGAQKTSFEESIAREKADLENSMKSQEEDERKRKEAVKKLQYSQDELRKRQEQLKLKKLQGLSSREEEDELQKIEGSIRWKKAEQEMLEGEQRAHEDIADQRELEMRIGKLWKHLANLVYNITYTVYYSL
jgi:hypothetical protein